MSKTAGLVLVVLLALLTVTTADAQCTTSSPCVSALTSTRTSTFAVDGTHVYWAAADTVYETPKSGGGSRAVASGENGAAVDAVDARYVYWHTPTLARRAPIRGGGPVETLLTSTRLRQVVLQGANVCVAALGAELDLPPDTCALQCITPQAVTRNMCLGRKDHVLVGPTGSLYWETGTGITSESRVQNLQGEIVSMPGIFTSAVSSDAVFFRASGTIFKASLSGGPATTVATQQDAAGDLTTDGMNVYWTNPHGGTVRKCSVSGGAITTIAAGQRDPERILVDASAVYFTTANGVMRASPN